MFRFLFSMNIQKTRHATYNINYHLVWCPKYRKPVLANPQLKQLIEDTIKEVCNQRGWVLRGISIGNDHIHVFLSARPIFSPMFIVKVLKGSTAVRAIKEHRFAARFWSPSYYVGTAGTVTEQTIQRYIAEQETR
jgi:putative transposase